MSVTPGTPTNLVTQDELTDAVALLETSIANAPKATLASQILPLFYDRLANEVACSQTIPGSYAIGTAPKLTGSVSGTAFTVTGGDDLALFGTGTWAAVLEQNGGETFNCLALSRTGSAVTITPAATFTGPATLHVRHDSNLGQHLTRPGYWALADDLLRSNFEPLDCVLRLSSQFVHGKQSPSYWRVFNGAPANLLDNYFSTNIAGANSVVTANRTRVTTATLSNTQGLELVLTLDETMNGEVHVQLGHNGPYGTAEVVVSLLVGGSVVATDSNFGPLKKHRLKFSNAKTLTVRVVSSYSAGTVVIRLTDVSVHKTVSTRPFLLPKEKLLIVGDSWTDEADFPGLTSRLADRHDGQVVSVGESGTQASYALAVVSGSRRIDAWLDEHTPNVCLIHYYINEANASVPKTTWASNINAICDACIAKGVQPVVVLGGCTASFSQTQNIVTSYGFAFDPPSQSDYPGDCLSLDFSSADSQINRVKKKSGRSVRDSETSRVYVAAGAHQSDAWFDVVNPSNVVIPKTFVGAQVTLANLSRFFGGAEQNASVLFDSSSNATNGTVTGSLSYSLDAFGTRRRVMSVGTGSVNCGTVLPLTTNWTMGGWFRFSTLASLQLLLNQATSGGNCAFGASSGNLAWFITANGGQPAVAVTNGPAIANNAWHHLAMRRNGNVFSYLLNGVVQLTQTDTGTRSIQNGPLLVSGDFAGLFKFQGSFCDLFTTNIALTDSQIAWLASFNNFVI